jgi:anti-sigma regulatory factor (Ser/Thr protein kinase)
MHRYGKGNRRGALKAGLSRDKNAQRLLISTRADLPPLFEELRSWMRVLGYPYRDIFALTLAVREATTNAFRHGNRGDPKKCIRIKYLVTTEEVVVEVEDQGRGFDLDLIPERIPEEYLDRPNGRGLFLMQVYTNWVSFNPKGNRVTLCRRRTDL